MRAATFSTPLFSQPPSLWLFFFFLLLPCLLTLPTEDAVAATAAHLHSMGGVKKEGSPWDGEWVASRGQETGG